MEALLRMSKNRSQLTSGRLFAVTFGKAESQKYAIYLNQQNQLRAGRLSNGDLLPFYSKVSQSKYGKPNSRWTLYDTGYFYSSMEVENVTDQYFTLNADGAKPDGRDWTEYAGGNVLGLTSDSMDQLVRTITPIMRDTLYLEPLK